MTRKSTDKLQPYRKRQMRPGWKPDRPYFQNFGSKRQVGAFKLYAYNPEFTWSVNLEPLKKNHLNIGPACKDELAAQKAAENRLKYLRDQLNLAFPPKYPKVVGYVIREGLKPKKGRYLRIFLETWQKTSGVLATRDHALEMMSRADRPCRIVRVVWRKKSPSV